MAFKRIEMKVISLARPGLDLLIIKSSSSNVIELVWRAHEPVDFNLSVP